MKNYNIISAKIRFYKVELKEINDLLEDKSLSQKRIARLILRQTVFEHLISDLEWVLN